LKKINPKHALNVDDEWVKGKPVSVGTVQLDNTGSKLITFESVSARAENLSSKAEKTSVWKV